jgi:hypothetical protein
MPGRWRAKPTEVVPPPSGRRSTTNRPTPIVGARRSWVRYAVLLGGLGWIGWQIIGNTIADTRASTDPEVALGWRSDLPSALVALSENKLASANTDQDLNEVSTLAKQALIASPVAAGAVRTIGLAEDKKGDATEARRLMDSAGKQSLRDTLAQAWLYDRDVADDQPSAAIARADTILRSHPELGDKLFPAMAKVASEPAGTEALVDLLATDPPWRSRLLSALPQLAPPSVTYGVLSGLQSGPHSPSPSETEPYIDQLVSSGQVQSAYLAWLHFLRSGATQAVSYAYNGDFELPISGQPFDWVISEVAGARTERVDTGDPQRGHAIRVTFANTRVQYHHLSKLMVLPPGHYELSGLAKADKLDNERGMTWRVYCAGGDKKMIAETPRISGTQPWQKFDAAFDVPADGCDGQWLTLELAARVALEQQVGGEIWYDDLAVSRADGNVATAAP